MNATVADITKILDTLAPFDGAEDFDNVGLLVGRSGAQVHNVLVALDVTRGVIEEAERLDAQMLVTHHPMMFVPRKRMTDEDVEGDLLLLLAEKRIALCACHTNYDIASGGVNDALMRAAGFANASGEGYLRFANLPGGMTLREIRDAVTQAMGCTVKAYGPADKKVTRLSCCSGAGGSMIGEALEGNADVFLTGEIKHNQALEAVQRGLCVLEAGHYETENPAMAELTKALQSACDAVQYKVRVFCSRSNPFCDGGV